MSKTQIVIISGKLQAGKSYAVRYLMDHLIPVQKCCYGLRQTLRDENKQLIGKEYSFAEPLKEFLINVMGLTREQCYGTNDQKNTLTHLRWAGLPFSTEELIRHRNDVKAKDEEFMTGREVMQIFGSNICRMMWPDCWANGTKNAILAENPKYAFISDARFPNELDIFADFDPAPIVIRLLRNPHGNSGHWSENALDKYDWSKFSKFIQIDNRNMTIEEKNKVLLEKVVPLL